MSFNFIESAAGTLGNPGIVIIAPQTTTINSAPEESLISLIGKAWPVGAPSGHALPIREIRLSSGAEFIVVVCGAIMTMPGLPRVPAADSIKLNKDGEIEGLF